MQEISIDPDIPVRYHNFLEWVARNGCKVDPRLKVPNIELGTIGVSVKQPIPERTVIMAIPQKLIMTMHRCYEDPELHELFTANDDLFDYEDSEDAEFNILAVFIMYQKAKIIGGKRTNPQQAFYSFWQPYLESIQSSETGMDWPTEDLEGLYPEVVQQIEFFKDEIETLCVKVLNFLKKRKQFNRLKRQEMYDLFHWAYKLVMTRCFGYSVPGTSLIPLADLMNHSCDSVDHQLINLSKEVAPPVQGVSYTKLSESADMTLLGGTTPSNKQIPKCLKFLEDQATIQFERAKYLNRKQKQKLIEKTYDEMKCEKPYNQQYYESSDQQDNDTETDQERERESQLQFLIAQEKAQLQEFEFKMESVTVVDYKTVKHTLDEFQDQEKHQQQVEEQSQRKVLQPQQATQTKTQIPSTQASRTDRVTQNQEPITQPETPTLLASQTSGPLPEISNPPTQTQLQQLKQNLQAKLKQFQADAAKQKFRCIPMDGDNSQQSQDSEQEYPWFEDKDTYFTMITQRAVNKGESLFNCYGRRTNKFLLIWYGFTYPQNLYDSVSFRFYVNFSYQKQFDSLIFDHYYGGMGLVNGFKLKNGMTVMKNELSRQFRLKKSNLNNSLLTFLRLFLMNQYKQPDLLKLFVTFPSSLRYQMFILEYLRKLVTHLRLRYPQETIQRWRDLEANNYRVKFKRVFYEEQIKILDDNEAMIDKLLSILKVLEGSKDTSVAEAVRQKCPQIHMVKKLRKYLKELQFNINYIRLETPATRVWKDQL